LRVSKDGAAYYAGKQREQVRAEAKEVGSPRPASPIPARIGARYDMANALIAGGANAVAAGACSGRAKYVKWWQGRQCR